MRDAENRMEIWLSLFSDVTLRVIVSQSFHFYDFFPLPVHQIVLIAYLKFLLMVYGQIKNISFLLIFETAFLYGVYIFHKN